MIRRSTFRLCAAANNNAKSTGFKEFKQPNIKYGMGVMSHKTEASSSVGHGRGGWTTENAAPGLKDHGTKQTKAEERDSEQMFERPRNYGNKARKGIIGAQMGYRIVSAFFGFMTMGPTIYQYYTGFAIDWEWAKQAAAGISNIWVRRNDQVFVQYITQRTNTIWEIWGLKSYDIEGKDDSTLDKIQPYYQDHMGKAGMPLPKVIPDMPDDAKGGKLKHY